MPHTQIRTSYDLGPEGRILIVSLEADPAAGAEISVTVPGRAVWDVLAMRFTLVTSADVATRHVNLHLDDGENTFLIIARPGTQAASLTSQYNYHQGADKDAATTLALRQPLPEHLTMLPGWRIRTVTLNLQAADNYSAPVLYIRETPQRGLAAGQDALLSALRRLIDREV